MRSPPAIEMSAASEASVMAVEERLAWEAARWAVVAAAEREAAEAAAVAVVAAACATSRRY